ncbi:hypothetical protein [Amycolatopsis cihanbeyliensis]|uniref:Uncharacterized protein n=1 Tax=Amycolatopsis cihanbeyliensis TaxID=1128664 RepID=A0A542DP41_AMYCI|nr:hypothetical protein [Amycolatopsis cihanbeyliensis]TQJ04872.1 hypothetical protein FB471_4682 [Amycolatopsis cihanbeyliensis]
MTDSRGRSEHIEPDAEPEPEPVSAEDAASGGEAAEPSAERSGPRHSAARSSRSPWNRKRDRVIATAIVVVCVVAGVLVWASGDQRATSLQTAPPPEPLPAAPTEVPGSLTEMWREPSAATHAPVVAGPTVITGSAGAVAGRNALTGQVRWRYARGLELCTVGTEWSEALAVYRKEMGCSEVTALDTETGRRTGQRNGDAEPGTRLVSDGKHVTTTGDTLLNTWRNDLVKTLEYGRVPAPVNPNKQPRTGCGYGSVAAAGGKVGVIERCPGDSADRLTVLESVPKDSDKPEEVFSVQVAGRSAQLVAMSDEVAAVALPAEKLLVLYGPEGTERSAYPLDLPAADLEGDPPGGVVSTAHGARGIYWFTGSSTMALSRTDLTPQWTVRGTRGPGTVFAGQYVVPINGGLAVLDEENGRTVRTVSVDRRGYGGPVFLDAAGPVLLEQRGETLVALR